jgi:hypothetical protein
MNLLFAELFELLGVRKLSEDNKESNLKEGRLLCKLLNGVASVLEDTFVSINIGDLRDL